MTEENRMQKHVTLLGIFHIVYRTLGLLVGIVLFVLPYGIPFLDVPPEEAAALRMVGTGVGSFLIAISIPGIIAGIWLLYRRPWARILAIIVGALGLLDIPFGTALGIYTFWVLMKDETVALFRPGTLNGGQPSR